MARPVGPARPGVGDRRRRPVAGRRRPVRQRPPQAIHRPQVCLAGTEQAVHDAGIAPTQLVFEVVESHAITDRGHLFSIMEHYRSLGWRVALDDVGAGWSSRSLLAAVRPDVVKLDKRLVQELPDDGARTALRAITDLAHRLGAVVVAEGVETEQAGRGGGRGRGRPRSGLAVRPPGPARAAEGGAGEPVAAGPAGPSVRGGSRGRSRGQWSPQPVSTGRACSWPRIP